LRYSRSALASEADSRTCLLPALLALVVFSWRYSLGKVRRARCL